MVGVKQKLILVECYYKGTVWTGDVYEIFDISMKQSRKALWELKKLEMYGLLKQIEGKLATFKLTNDGKKFVKEHCHLE